MLNYTQGDWSVDREDGEIVVVNDDDGVDTILIFGPRGQGYGRVAMAYAECGRVDELEGNAKLLALAPKLLEMCEKVLNYRRGLGEYNFTHLNKYDRENHAFDSWLALENEIEDVLDELA